MHFLCSQDAHARGSKQVRKGFIGLFRLGNRTFIRRFIVGLPHKLVLVYVVAPCRHLALEHPPQMAETHATLLYRNSVPGFKICLRQSCAPLILVDQGTPVAKLSWTNEAIFLAVTGPRCAYARKSCSDGRNSSRLKVFERSISPAIVQKFDPDLRNGFRNENPRFVSHASLSLHCLQE
jgi:hypothetical protein